jgi:hypothetical protein
MIKTRAVTWKQVNEHLGYSLADMHKLVAAGKLDVQKVAGTYVLGFREGCQLAGMKIPDWWKPQKLAGLGHDLHEKRPGPDRHFST